MTTIHKKQLYVKNFLLTENIPGLFILERLSVYLRFFFFFFSSVLRVGYTTVGGREVIERKSFSYPEIRELLERRYVYVFSFLSELYVTLLKNIEKLKKGNSFQ